MRPARVRSSLTVLALVAACHSVDPKPQQGSTSWPQLQGARHLDGLLDVHVQADQGRAWLVLPPPGERGVALECLYVEGLTTGLGSNDVGLDRGQLGPTRVIAFRVIGQRVLVEAANLAFRAVTRSGEEQAAARESFASSVLWAGEVEARTGDGRVLVDFTSFLVRDAHGVGRTLDRDGQSRWTFDADRSTLDPDASLAFPDNIELEAILTFRSDNPGPRVRETVPDAHAVTLVQHHSFIRLPDDGYHPRPHDPRTGSNAITYLDYAAPLDGPVERRFAVRHRLKKVEPGSASSPVEEPIVYHVDRAAPEPIRSALLEGAGWWARAFAAAGFADAFRVELLPPGVHPLDARYHVIEWVHRSTRGWSYGGGVVDPRTGEVVKGHVNLGSLRVRQDRRLFEGLVGTGATGTGTADDPVQLSLARIRQLAAHEVGHTLGLQHNFAASTYGGRASVMDYPAPLVRADGDELDVTDAYSTGLGSWDLHTIRCLHAECPPGEDELAFLDRLAREGIERGELFLSDADARPAGAAHPLANLWDNGANPVEELVRVLEVRRIAIARFGAQNQRPGRPAAELQEVFVPVYFYHRYQLLAALKTVGGFTYRHALAGDGREPLAPVGAEDQRAALEAILLVLEPAELDIPEELLRRLPPRAPGSSRNREMFESGAEPGIDPMGIAGAAARAVFAGLLQPQRLNRIADFERRGDDVLTLDELVAAITDQVVRTPVPASSRYAALQDVVRHALIDEWIRLLGAPELSGHVRARMEALLAAEVEVMRTGSGAAASDGRMVAKIDRFLERPWWQGQRPDRSPELPPGSPIGSGLGACGFDLDGPGGEPYR